MALVPYRESLPFVQLRDEINRLFSNVGDGETSGATASWVPAVDIHEYQDRFELAVDLPGVSPEAVEVTLANGVLTLSGERTNEKVVNNSNERRNDARVERATGRFYRRFILPDSIDTEQIKATGRNGVLEISIPKQAKAQPRRIQVAA
jgi:HSP20 family protein